MAARTKNRQKKKQKKKNKNKKKQQQQQQQQQTLKALDQWTDFKIISLKCSLNDSLPKLLNPFRSTEQDGRHS